MRNRKSNFIGLLLSISILLFWGSPMRSENYPDKPVDFIDSSSPGGGGHACFRPLVNAAQKYLGQPVIIETKTGGGITAGVSYVLSKNPDGYNIGTTFLHAATISYHMGKLNFSPVEDFTHIIRWGMFPYGLVVRADSKWKTFNEFIQYAKSSPRKVSCAIPGVGGLGHLAMAAIALQAGIQINFIPYKGSGETNTALLGGHVDALSDSAGWAPLIDAGKFRMLVSYGDKRMDRYPNVPTLKENGFDMVWSCPTLLYGPKGLPKPIVKKLHDAFQKAMDDSTFQSTLKKFDVAPLSVGPEDSVKEVRKESEVFAELVKKLNLRRANE